MFVQEMLARTCPFPMLDVFKIPKVLTVINYTVNTVVARGDRSPRRIWLSSDVAQIMAKLYFVTGRPLDHMVSL